MAKNPNKKVAPKDEPMNGAMKFFLAGCVAELYLLILRRFYINADSELTRIAWYDHYLWTLAGIGAGVLAVGVIAALVLRSSAQEAEVRLDPCCGRCLCGCSYGSGPLEYGHSLLYDDRCAGHHAAGDPLGAV